MAPADIPLKLPAESGGHTTCLEEQESTDGSTEQEIP